MGRETPPPASSPQPSLLIEGDFSPSRGARLLRLAMMILMVLLAVAFVATVAVYGVVVHYESNINAASKQTRLLNEEIKDLQVSLNRLQSYDKVSQAVAQMISQNVPLQEADEIIEVDARHRNVQFPKPVARQEAYPKTYGY